MSRPGAVDHHHHPDGTTAAMVVAGNGTEWSHYQAYLTWINCQLKKHPQAIRPVQDIRHELQDGTIVASLIEILGSHRLAGVDWQPAPQALPVRMANYNAVLRYLTLQRVNLHPSINVPDLAQGNLKTQMRLVHAIAGHFKPESITSSTTGPATRAHSQPNNHMVNVPKITGGGGNSSNSSTPPQVVPKSHSSIITVEHDIVNKTPSKTGSLPLPSPLRKCKSYTSLRNPLQNGSDGHRTASTDREPGVRRVTFDHVPISTDLDVHSEEEADTSNRNSFGDDDSAEVREIKEKLQEMMKRAVAALTTPMRTDEETKNSLENQQNVFIHCIESLSASNQALHADISCYKDRCSILETAKSGLLSKIHHVEQELHRVRDELQKMQLMNLNCGSSTSSSASSSSPSLEQAELQKKIDFKNRQLAELRKELDLKEEFIAQLCAKDQHSSGGYRLSKAVSGFQQEENTSFLPAHAKPLQSTGDYSTVFSTKVLYYLEGCPTPIRCTIPKHFREVTLQDVRKAIDRSSVYRYYFDTIDPDVGRVKEEVSRDTALVPDVDGKIIVTLELASLDTHV